MIPARPTANQQDAPVFFIYLSKHNPRCINAPEKEGAMDTITDQLHGFLRAGNVYTFNKKRPKTHAGEEPLNLSGVIISRETNLRGVDLARVNL